jgi:hypothetical protein
MPGPFIARRLNGRPVIGFIGNAKRQDVVCNLCGAIGSDLPIGAFSEQWLIGHVKAKHPARMSRPLELYASPDFTISAT